MIQAFDWRFFRVHLYAIETVKKIIFMITYLVVHLEICCISCLGCSLFIATKQESVRFRNQQEIYGRINLYQYAIRGVCLSLSGDVLEMRIEKRQQSRKLVHAHTQ